MLGANLDQPQLLTLADPNGEARAVVDGAAQVLLTWPLAGLKLHLHHHNLLKLGLLPG